MRRRSTRFTAALWAIALTTLGMTNGHAEPGIVVGGTGSPLGSMQILADAYMKQNDGAEILVLPSLGSGGGIKGLIAGKIHIALSARPLNEDEAAGGLTDILYAKTPVVFATNADNPNSAVTLDWIADAYAGAVTEWPEGEHIRLVLRPLHDSDSIILSEASPLLKQAIEAAHARRGLIVAEDAQGAADALESLNGTLGTSTLTQVLSEGPAIKALTLDGVTPDARTLADGTYPFEKLFYLVTGPATSDEARDFVDFIRSDAGKALLVATGNQPL